MAIAEILAAGATVALDAVGVAAAVLLGLALAPRTLGARRGRMGSRFIAASALASCVAGVGFATMISRADEPLYDEDEAVAERVRDGRKRFEVPAGLELAPVSGPIASLERFEPLEPGAITILVDARGVRVGGRTFAVGPLQASCALTPVAQALAWERRAWQAAHPGKDPSYTEVDLVIDARTPYRNVFAAWKWVACEGFSPSLVLAGPRGEVGALRTPHRTSGILHVGVSTAGYRVFRREERGSGSGVDRAKMAP